MNTKVVIGVAATFGTASLAARSQLFIERDNRPGCRETPAAIHEATAGAGWIVPKQYQLDASLSKARFDVLPESARHRAVAPDT